MGKSLSSAIIGIRRDIRSYSCWHGIGWTTDLQGTVDKIVSYLKKDGIFIFSWHHTLNYCIAWSCDERREVFDKDQPIMMKSYFDASLEAEGDLDLKTKKAKWLPLSFCIKARKL